jgi:hypothetical protein
MARRRIIGFFQMARPASFSKTPLRFYLLAAVLWLSAAPAFAQTWPAVGANSVVGRTSAAGDSGTLEAIPFAQLAASLSRLGLVQGPTAAIQGHAAVFGAVPNVVVDGGAFLPQNVDLACLAALSATGVIHRTGSGTCAAAPVALGSDVSGNLPLANVATGTSDTALGYWGSTVVSALAIGNCSGALTYSTSTHTFGCNTTAGTGTVTTAGNGLTLSGGGSTLGITAPVYVTSAPYNAVCDGVTDDSTAIQAAINAMPATGGYLAIPSGKFCNFGTTLSFVGHNYITLTGFGTRTAGAASASGLRYTGTVRGFDLRDTYSITLQNLYLTWTSTTFSGNFIDATTASPGTGISSFFVLRDSDVLPPSGTTLAATCVNIANAIEVLIERVAFGPCAPAIKGSQNTGSPQNTTTTIRDNQFIGYSQSAAAIQGCGEAWVIENNAFEPSSTGQAGAFLNFSSAPCNGIAFIGNWFGDVTANGGTWVSVTANGFTFTGNRISANSTTSNVGIGISGGAGYFIGGNSFNSFSIAISCSGTASGFQPLGNSFVNVTTSSSAGTCTP